MDSSTPSQTEQYQPLTSPQFKSAKCFAGKKILISKEANTVLQSLSGINKSKLNNQMSCIATSNVSPVSKNKLYIELVDGLLEFIVSRKANRTEIMIEKVRYLEGLRKPWTGQPVKPTKHHLKKANRAELNIYYTKPIYSYPEERLRDFLLRIAPMMRGLTGSEYDSGGIRILKGAEFASAIFVATGSVKQYALILETQGLPHLSVATRRAPQGFRTKMSHSNGVSKRETVHIHGKMNWSSKVGDATLALIEVYGGSDRDKESLKKMFYSPYAHTKGAGNTVRGDKENFSKPDYANPGWLVTGEACLKYQKGSNTDIDMGCPQ